MYNTRMRKENSINTFLRAGLVVSLLGIPVLNHASSIEVIKALSGSHVDCSTDESLDPGNKYDLIAVPGAGTTDVNVDGVPVPNSFEEGRLKAAALAKINGYASNVILLDGDQAVGEVDRDRVISLVDELSEGRVKLPKKNVFIDAESINTATNMSYLKKFVDAQGMDRVLIVTDEFHGDRTIILARNKGVNACLSTVEELVGKYAPLDLIEINRRTNSDAMKLTKLKEELETILLMYDPEGKIPTALKLKDSESQGE